MRDTWPLLEQIAFPPIRRGRLDTLQVNVGYRCNQILRALPRQCRARTAPRKCRRRWSTSSLAFLATKHIATLDITGGAPELNPHFRRLVTARARIGVHVMDRCNLTILERAGPGGPRRIPRQRAGRDRRVDAVLSRGQCRPPARQGRVRSSIRGLQKLNALGYGHAAPGSSLNLVYNPQGPSLPPPQEALEADYKRVLGERYGIAFNRLYTLANMPIKRFGAILLAKGEFDRYLGLLRARASRRQSRARDVPQPHLGRLAGLRLRLRFQPDARPAASSAMARERSTCPTCSMPISPAIRSGLPAIATAAPRGRDRAAAARCEKRRSDHAVRSTSKRPCRRTPA